MTSPEDLIVAPRKQSPKLSCKLGRDLSFYGYSEVVPASMNPALVKSVGTYGGPSAVILLIEWFILQTLAKIPASSEQRQQRFLILARTNLILAILAIGSLFFAHLSLPININSNNKTSTTSTTTNTTSGTLSPILPDNCGSVTISGGSNQPKPSQKK